MGRRRQETCAHAPFESPPRPFPGAPALCWPPQLKPPSALRTGDADRKLDDASSHLARCASSMEAADLIDRCRGRAMHKPARRRCRPPSPASREPQRASRMRYAPSTAAARPVCCYALRASLAWTAASRPSTSPASASLRLPRYVLGRANVTACDPFATADNFAGEWPCPRIRCRRLASGNLAVGMQAGVSAGTCRTTASVCL